MFENLKAWYLQLSAELKVVVAVIAVLLAIAVLRAIF